MTDKEKLVIWIFDFGPEKVTRTFEKRAPGQLFLELNGYEEKVANMT